MGKTELISLLAITVLKMSTFLRKLNVLTNNENAKGTTHTY